jgi:hypothetical protein
MKIAEHLHSQIEGEKVSLMLFGWSEAEAEAKAVAKIKAAAAAAKANQEPNKPQPTPTASYVDSETKKAADEIRRILLSPLNVTIDDIGDYTDEQLAELVEQWGFK